MVTEARLRALRYALKNDPRVIAKRFAQVADLGALLYYQQAEKQYAADVERERLELDLLEAKKIANLQKTEISVIEDFEHFTGYLEAEIQKTRYETIGVDPVVIDESLRSISPTAKCDEPTADLSRLASETEPSSLYHYSSRDVSDYGGIELETGKYDEDLYNSCSYGVV